MVAILARYAARFSVRALDLTVDASLLWVGVGLAAAAAVLLAFVPRLPSADATDRPRPVERQPCASRPAPTAGCACSPSRRLPRRSCCSPAPGMLLTTLFALQRPRTGFDTRNVLAIERAARQLRAQAAGDRRLLQGSDAPHRGAARRRARRRSAPWCRGATPAPSVRASSSRRRATRAPNGEEDPRARFRTVSPGFFAALGVPIIAGRDFTDADRTDAEKVVIVSQSVAQRMFPKQDAVNRHLMWTDPVMKFIDVSTGAAPHRRRRRRTSTTRTSCRGRR